MAHARVIATRGLSRLTVLLSVAEVCFGAYPAFTLAYFDTNRTAYGALLAGLNLLMTRLTIGLAVGIVVGAVSMFFDGCLIRRKASWLLFRATAADASPQAPD
jgi:hypothetical protein